MQKNFKKIAISQGNFDEKAVVGVKILEAKTKKKVA